MQAVSDDLIQESASSESAILDRLQRFCKDLKYKTKIHKQADGTYKMVSKADDGSAVFKPTDEIAAFEKVCKDIVGEHDTDIAEIASKMSQKIDDKDELAKQLLKRLNAKVCKRPCRKAKRSEL